MDIVSESQGDNQQCETYYNVSNHIQEESTLVTSSYIPQQLCRLKEIRAGINAFSLIEKECMTTNIPLDEEIILKAFRVRSIFHITAIVNQQNCK